MSTNTSNFTRLNLTDTFYNWYLKTNQIIDFIEPLNVYDVLAGDGLKITRSGQGPYVVELDVNTSASVYGIDTDLAISGLSVIILNIPGLNEIESVKNNDVFVVSENVAKSRSYKVFASDMLPPVLNGNHSFLGSIDVNDLTVNNGAITLLPGTTSSAEYVIGLYGDISGVDADWIYDPDLNAWISGENVGIKPTKHFVSSNSGNAIFSFFADPITNNGIVDLRLGTEDGSDKEYWSVRTNGTSLPNILSFNHYTNTTLNESPLQLEVNGTNGSNITRVNGSIIITDIQNSQPFSLTPRSGYVPLMDSDGFLNKFTNRVKLDYTGSPTVGSVVKLTSVAGQAELASAADTNSSYAIGIVESVSGGKVTVITSGEFTLSSGSFTAGAIYYLQDTPGQVGTNPGTVSKPIFIAKGTNSGIIPDFSGMGGTGSGLTSAFTSLQIVGEGTFTSSGATALVLKQGTGIDLRLTTNNQLEVSSTITGMPSASAYSVFNTQATTVPTSTTVNAFSLLGRPLSGNISSITVDPGTVLGRLDDTNDNDNPIQSITFPQLRQLLGFTSSSYFDTMIFRDSGGSIVKQYNASTSQTINIQAGTNVVFTEQGNTLYISSLGGDTTQGPSVSPLSISAGNSTFTNVTSIDFSDSENEGTNSFKQFIKFLPVSGLPTGQTRVFARPGSDFMLFRAGSTTTNFKEITQTTLEIAGSTSTGVAIALSNAAAGPLFTVSLSSTISVNKVRPISGSTLTLSGTTAGRDTIKITDNAASTSEININARNTDFTFDDKTRSPDNEGYCVSILADDTTAQPSGAFKSHPFKFYKLIVNDIQVLGGLTVTNSFKENFYATKISSDTTPNVNVKHPTLSNQPIGYINFYNDRTDPQTPGSNGFSLQFRDSNESLNTAMENTTNTATIFHPDSDLTGFTNANYRKCLVISDKICFANLNTTTTITTTPTMGWNNLTGGIEVNGIDASTAFMRYRISNQHFDVGTRTDYGIIKWTKSSDTASLKINKNPVFYGINSLFLTTGTTEDATNPTSGLKINVGTYSTASLGQVAVINTVSGGLATVEFKSIIKNISTQNANDPIGTIYYSNTV